MVNLCIKLNYFFLHPIGFGDLVAGRTQKTLDELDDWEFVYLAGVFVWIIFGLGYIFMIIGIIADGIKQPARKAVKKLAQAEKAILARVLQEVVDIKSSKEEKQNENEETIQSFSQGYI